MQQQPNHAISPSTRFRLMQETDGPTLACLAASATLALFLVYVRGLGSNLFLLGGDDDVDGNAT